jgi:SH3 domain protein
MNQSFKTAVLILLALVLTVASATAQTLYVAEGASGPTITLRTGPGTDRKIVALLSTGRALEVVTPGDDWTEVRADGDKQGWALTRYLTNKEPAANVLARLENQYAQIKEKYQALQKQVGQMSSEGKSLSGDLASTQAALQKTTAEYEALKTESAEFLKLKAKYEKALKDANEARSTKETLEQELQALYNSQILKGMLIGCGLIVLGFVTAWIFKRPKRRSSLL